MKKNWLKSLLIGLVAFAIGIGLMVVWQQGWIQSLFGGSKEEMISVLPDAKPGRVSGYVAVFLTNNQVYFGKLTDEKSQYPVLKDVYYLRAQSTLQPPVEDSKADTKATVRTAQPKIEQEMKLIKLGNELHGPADEIRLNRDQILFIEPLKADSKVVQAIEQYKLQTPVQ